MRKISATIITKNEEANIGRCLKSLGWVDEIVVLDSGSTDKTLEICAKYNAKIVKTEWLGFGRTKKAAVEAAGNNWVLSIDADEEVSMELKIKAQKILDNQINSLEKIPKRCPVISESRETGIELRHLIYGNYRTIFLIENKKVYILRVINCARLLNLEMF